MSGNANPSTFSNMKGSASSVVDTKAPRAPLDPRLASLEKLSTNVAEILVDDSHRATFPRAKRTVPPWYSHNKLYSQAGEHNCGNHVHDSTKMGEIKVCHAAHAWSNGKPSSSLHILACGHALCRECLMRKGRQIGDAMLANHRELTLLLQHYSEPEEINFNNPTALAKVFNDSLKKPEDLERDLLTEVARLACLGCCGPHLLDHASCMDPVDAQALFIAMLWLQTRPSRRLACGWADCAAFLSGEQTRFFDENSGAHGCDKWLCPHCLGRSQLDLDAPRGKKDGDEETFPFRLAGYVKLYPAK